MRKLASYKEFEKGKIYNRVYVGENKAYANINGKQTFIVVDLEPELVVQTLFAQFGSVQSDRLTSNEITFGSPEITFNGYELYEVENEKEWFKKSQIMTLDEAVSAGFITPDDIRRRAKHFIAIWLDPGNGYYNSYPVGGKSKTNPYLQMVYFKWNSIEEMESDLAKYEAEA